MAAPLKVAFDLPFAEALAQATSRAKGLRLADEYYHQLPIEKRSQAFTVSYLSSLDQVQTVLDRLTHQLAHGGSLASFQKWAKEQDFSLSKAHLETIYRNGVQTAYNAGHWRRFEEDADHRPYLMYDAINDGRTRPAHKAMDGIIKPVGDAWWATHSPPCGHRCRCRLVNLTREQAEKRGGETLNPPTDARADKNWGSKPKAWSERLEQIETEKLAKAHPALRAVAKEVMDNGGMKTLTNTQKADFAQWATVVLVEGYRAQHQFKPVGYLPERVLADADVQALELQSDEIEISDFLLRHGMRQAKTGRGAALSVEQMAILPEMLESARWFYDSSHGNIIAVSVMDDSERLVKMVVHINYQRRKELHNAVVTTGIIQSADIKAPWYREI